MAINDFSRLCIPDKGSITARSWHWLIFLHAGRTWHWLVASAPCCFLLRVLLSLLPHVVTACSLNLNNCVDKLMAISFYGVIVYYTSVAKWSTPITTDESTIYSYTNNSK